MSHTTSVAKAGTKLPTLLVLEVDPAIGQRVADYADRPVKLFTSLGAFRECWSDLSYSADIIINGNVSGSSAATLEFIRALTYGMFIHVYVTSAYAGYFEQMAAIPGTTPIEFAFYPKFLSMVI